MSDERESGGVMREIKMPPPKPPIDWGAVGARVVAWPLIAMWLLFASTVSLALLPIWLPLFAARRADGMTLMWQPWYYRAVLAIARASRRPVRRDDD